MATVKLQELQIGGIFHDTFNQIGEIAEIHQKGVYYHISGGGYGYCSIDKIEPIPITEEWLKRCGFDKFNIFRTKDKFYYTHTIDSRLVYNESQEAWWYIGRLANPPKYVHKLQMLFYSLTGEELKISEA